MIEEKYVDIRNKEERKDFIENLETKGYIIDKTFFNRDDIIGGIFPLVVDLTNKKKYLWFFLSALIWWGM